MAGNRRMHVSSSTCALLLLLQLCHQPMAESMYHASGEILHWFSHTAKRSPQRLKYKETLHKETNVLMPLATITDFQHGQPSKRPQAILVFGEHAREVITSEVALWLARLLVDDESDALQWPELHEALARAVGAPQAGGGAAATQPSQKWAATIRAWVARITSSLVIQMVPLESVEARRQVEQGELCLRKTLTNVDLNRNWEYAWRKEHPRDEQYGGPSPWSEPQTRMMRELALSAPTAAFVNVHSGEWAAYTPWDSKRGYAPGLPADLPDLAAKLGAICNCRVGPAGAASGYLAYGTSMDWMYTHQHVPYPLTLEVYGSGGEGRLRRGRTNPPLDSYPLLEDVPVGAGSTGQGGGGGAAGAQAGRRRALLHGGSAPQLPLAARTAGGSRRWQLPRKLARRSAQAAAAAPAGVDQGDLLMRLYSNAGPEQQACFALFNPVVAADYRHAVSDWLAALLVILHHVSESSTLQRLGQAQQQQQGAGTGAGRRR